MLRNSQSNQTTIEDYYERLDECIALYKIGPKQLWNGDEVSLIIKESKIKVVTTRSEIRKQRVSF